MWTATWPLWRRCDTTVAGAMVACKNQVRLAIARCLAAIEPLLSFELPISTSGIPVARLLLYKHAASSRLGAIKYREPWLPVRQTLIAPIRFDCDQSEALCKQRYLLGGRSDFSRVAAAPVHIFAIVRELFLRRHREYDHAQSVERVVVDVRKN